MDAIDPNKQVYYNNKQSHKNVRPGHLDQSSKRPQSTLRPIKPPLTGPPKKYITHELFPSNIDLHR